MLATPLNTLTKNKAAGIQKILFFTLLAVLFGRYLGSTGASSSDTFTLATPEIAFLFIIYLLQAIPLLLLQVTKIAYFKHFFLFSQIIAFICEIPGLDYLSGNDLYGGFLGALNRIAGYTTIWALFLHILLFFYVKSETVDALLKHKKPHTT